MTHDDLGLLTTVTPDELLGLALLFAVCLGLGAALGGVAAVLTLGRGRGGRLVRGVQ